VDPSVECRACRRSDHASSALYDGSVNEIDALVVTQAGVFLIEVESRGGIVNGNRHLWDWNKDGHTVTVDSPLTLANSKARKLAGLVLADVRV
jgi:Nuclease-related domain